MDREHTWQAITVEDVGLEMVDGEPTFFSLGKSETRVGCTRCNLRLDLAVTVPCPGRTLEQMLAQESHTKEG